MAAWEEVFKRVFGLLDRPLTMMDRYNQDNEPVNWVGGKKEAVTELTPHTRGEQSSAPRTMMDRYNKKEGRSMMQRLADRDDEREKLAKAEQAKMDPTVSDYNAIQNRPITHEPAPSSDSGYTPGSEEFQSVVETTPTSNN